MARVEVTDEELHAGDFPAVCAKSGDRTAHVIEIQGRLVNASARWLIVAGGLPYVFYRLWLAQRFRVKLPMSPAYLELQQRHRRPLRLLATVGIVVGAIGVALGPSRVALAIIAGGLLTTAFSLTVLYARLREEQFTFIRTKEGTIEVQGIHPRFRDALASGEDASTPLTELPSPGLSNRDLRHPYRSDAVIDRRASPAP